MARNSCRNPFTHLMDLSVRQRAARRCASSNVSVQWDIFNFGNLLNKNWGKAPFTPRPSTATCPS